MVADEAASDMINLVKKLFSLGRCSQQFILYATLYTLKHRPLSVETALTLHSRAHPLDRSCLK